MTIGTQDPNKNMLTPKNHELSAILGAISIVFSLSQGRERFVVGVMSER